MTRNSKFVETQEEAASSRAVPEDLPAYRQDRPHQFARSGRDIDSPDLLLDLNNPESVPSAKTCLVHLRLLRAFEVLKQKIAYTEGLWNIFDAQAQGNFKILAKLQEKRWALYVARAVDRYEAWWKSFVPDMLLESDMLEGGNARRRSYEEFTRNPPMRWNADILPPPDVLLVWHNHMLNPRIYLEDCLIFGYGSLWSAGLPWNVIDQAINGDFEFVAPRDAQINWTARTQRPWANQEDSMYKKIKCPLCSELKLVPWTTCRQQLWDPEEKRTLTGHGFGDSSFATYCHKCSATIDEELLRAGKFHDDLKHLITKDWPMPGTMIDGKDGLIRRQDAYSDQLFPNRLVRLGLAVEVTAAFDPANIVRPSMAFIQDKIDEIMEQTKHRHHSSDKLKTIDKGMGGISTVVHRALSRAAHEQTRCMMSRYWTNSSMFGVDLKGAVMRQGFFCEKMFKINWLQNSAATDIIEELLVKYERFFDIVAAHPAELVTPTLDVDLAWHTHQLSPKNYFDYTVEKSRAFADHDDKLNEEKLAISFEWTAKTYQKRYDEVYSECTCRFCEGLRNKIAHPLSSLFTSNKDTADTEVWRTNGDQSVEPLHISSHPSVHPILNHSEHGHRKFYHDLVSAHEMIHKQSDTDGGHKISLSTILKHSPFGH